MSNPQNGKFKVPLKDILIAIGCVLVVVFGVMGTMLVYPFPKTATNVSDQYISLVPNQMPTLRKTSGTYAQVLSYAGSNRTYLLHLPPAGAVKKNMALVLAFHGAGENAEIMADRGFNAKADTEGFMVVYPDGTSATGNTGDGFTYNAQFCCGYAFRSNVDDVGFISALLDHLKESYPIDPGRVYATGFSNGGMLSYLLAMQLGDKIAAIAPVSAEFRGTATPQVPVAVFSMHGLEDTVVAYANDQSQNLNWARFNGCTAYPTNRDSRAASFKSYCVGSVTNEVDFYTVKEGVHQWFGNLKGLDGQETTGVDLIWDFFASHYRA